MPARTMVEVVASSFVGHLEARTGLELELEVVVVRCKPEEGMPCCDMVQL